MHTRRCGPLVASRPPGNLNSTTNTRPIFRERPIASFEQRWPEFWLGYIFFLSREVNPQTKCHSVLIWVVAKHIVRVVFLAYEVVGDI